MSLHKVFGQRLRWPSLTMQMAVGGASALKPSSAYLWGTIPTHQEEDVLVPIAPVMDAPLKTSKRRAGEEPDDEVAIE
jgi:hypothetical protein